MTFKLMNIKRLDKNMRKIERSMLFKHKKSNPERAAFLIFSIMLLIRISHQLY